MTAAFAFYDFKPASGTLLEDVIAGLSANPKALPPKYFYDKRGSQLFDAICDLPEYYPTRTELAMLEAASADVARRVGPRAEVIEYGSGSGRKTVTLLRALKPAAYIAIDISSEQLQSAVRELAAAFPDVRMAAVYADYSRPLDLPRIEGASALRRMIYFPGSTIGNFSVEESRAFLRNARALAGTGGAMLVGVDLKKDAAVLHAAYNDAQGVTAAFNLNLLARLNRELGADFDLDAFRHDAYYNESAGRIEMHLASLRDQQVTIGGHAFHFARGETIHTENSYKYAPAEFQALAREAGFEAEHCWVDPQALFSMHYLTVP